MGEAQVVHFSFDGGWITDLARTWFWDENKPYETCEELLLNSLCTDAISLDERKAIACEIIEGRKKLVGVNTFSLEDDNENVRPIYLKLNEVRRKLDIEKIESDMFSNAIKYVDPWATVKSIRVAKESGSHNSVYRSEVRNRYECENYFRYSDEDIDITTGVPYVGSDVMDNVKNLENGGLWLLDEPEIVYDIVGDNISEVGKEEFWDKVYDLVKDNDFLKRRNNRYLAYKRMKDRTEGSEVIEWKSISDSQECPSRKLEQIKFLENRLSSIVGNDDTKDIQKFELEMSLDVLKECNVETDKDLLYYMKPDDYIKWEGLVAPNGDFFSCSFGGHNVKAYNLILGRSDLFPGIDYSAGSIRHGLNIDNTNALDELLRQGWCATRYLPYRGQYIYTPEDVGVMKEPTKAQKDAIFDAMQVHQIDCDLSKIGF